MKMIAGADWLRACSKSARMVLFRHVLSVAHRVRWTAALRRWPTSHSRRSSWRAGCCWIRNRERIRFRRQQPAPGTSCRCPAARTTGCGATADATRGPLRWPRTSSTGPVRLRASRGRTLPTYRWGNRMGSSSASRNSCFASCAPALPRHASPDARDPPRIPPLHPTGNIG